MADKRRLVAAMKAIPGARPSAAPQPSGYGNARGLAAMQGMSLQYGTNGNGPFMPRPPQAFTDGAFGPMSPIQPVPVDNPPPGGEYPDPRWWQYREGWNLPTPPGTEGLKLASFDQLKTISERYSVARACIDTRQQEIRGLEWEITPTKEAAKAYQGSHARMKDFGERAAEAVKFFKRPDPDYWNFDSFLNAILEEIFVYDALSIVFRPKYGAKFGRGGRGLLGSDLDSLRVVSGPTVRPLVDLYGGHPAPPAPAYQQYLYGVPRSDYLTIMRGDDIDDYGLSESKVGEFSSDLMLYAPYWPRRETPYGFPPVERALLPIISGLQKQEFQLDYFSEGCHSFDTEILTENGWKLFTELSPEDRVATRSGKGVFEWQLPTEYHEYQHDGELVAFRNKSVDMLVTPSHRMLVKRPAAYLAKHAPRDGETGYHMRPAGMIADSRETRWIIPAVSEWTGSEPEVFTCRDIGTPNHPARDLTMPVEAFSAFLGLYLAEGWTRRDRNSIFIAQQENSRHFADIQRILEATGITWTYLRSNHRFEASNRALAEWLKANTGERAWGKKIPQEIKDFSPRLLGCLLDGAMMGDGHQGPLGQRYYTTTSKRLADDFQEIFQKLGRDAWIRVEPTKEYPGRFGRSEVKKQVYVVRERMQEEHWLPKPVMEEYHGKVYCVTVPNGVIYTRRNGRAAWAGNSVPAVYISPGDPNITPTQIRELQDALNGIAGDPAYHMKVVVLPPGSKVEPQRPIDLSDSFDTLVQTQVCQSFDINPMELGILPNLGGGGQSGPSASSVRIGMEAARDIKSRKSTKPTLKYLCDIFNYVLQDICGQKDMRFQFEGLADDEDKQAITELGVQQVQNGIASIDEVRDRLDLAPWGLQETSEPVVFTAQGPIPFSMAPQLIAAMQNQGQQQNSSGGKSNNGTQSTNSGQRTSSSRSRTSQPSVRQGGQTKPNGTHPKPVSPHRESLTPAHSAAAGAIQSPGPRTGGTPSRSAVAGSRKDGPSTTGRSVRHKAIEAEFDSLKRHLRKGRLISTWEARHIPERALSMIAEDLAKGYLLDVAVDQAESYTVTKDLGAIDPDWQDEGEDFRQQHGIDGTAGDAQDVPHPFDGGARCRGCGLSHDAAVHKAQQWPGWEHDLGLVGRYKQELAGAFNVAHVKGEQLRQKAATGQMYVSNSTLRGLISEQVRETFTDVLRPLWADAWSLGYEAAKSLVTGTEPDFTAKHEGDALEGFIATEGEHWLGKIAQTGIENAPARSEIIARTEVARAMNEGALQAYHDFAVTHKHLGLSPDDACDICKDAEEEGVIPLDAIFPGGDPPFHPSCRCAPLPAGVDVEPPQGHIGKSDQEDPNRLCWLLLRARDEDGKWRFLLQQRDDGTWGMPGGSAHVGEDPWDGALREATEEIGDLPSMVLVRDFTHQEDDGKTAYLYLCECEYFTPKLNGSTPWETRGVAWFRRKEVDELDLVGKFREDWDERPGLRDQVTKSGKPREGDRNTCPCGTPVIYDEMDGWQHADGSISHDDGESVSDKMKTKALQREVNPSGEVLLASPGAASAQGGGADWPHPHRAADNGYPVDGRGHYNSTAGEMGAPEPPRQDLNSTTPTRIYPRGDESDEFPRRRTRNQGPKRQVNQGGERWPEDEDEEDPGPDASQVGGNTGVPPGARKGTHVAGMGTLRPVTGSVAATTPHPYEPHSEPGEEPFDPSLVVPVELPDGGNAYRSPAKKGASDYSDPNPVDAEHIYNQLAKNFPAQAIEWVKRAHWVGPVWVPWSRVDTDDRDSWAASHQPEHVKEFERKIKEHKGHVAPSVLVQEPDGGKAFIVDGHHRALARENLHQKVLAYLGTIRPADRVAALETHAKQVHQGSDKRNG